jgi:hypothetical protein
VESSHLWEKEAMVYQMLEDISQASAMGLPPWRLLRLGAYAASSSSTARIQPLMPPCSGLLVASIATRQKRGFGQILVLLYRSAADIIPSSWLFSMAVPGGAPGIW